MWIENSRVSCFCCTDGADDVGYLWLFFHWNEIEIKRIFEVSSWEWSVFIRFVYFMIFSLTLIACCIVHVKLFISWIGFYAMKCAKQNCCAKGIQNFCNSIWVVEKIWSVKKTSAVGIQLNWSTFPSFPSMRVQYFKTRHTWIIREEHVMIH